MDHKVSKDMISSGMIPSGEKTQADLGRTQYGSTPSPNSLFDAYKSIYEHHQKDKDGNTIPHEGEEIKEEPISLGLLAAGAGKLLAGAGAKAAAAGATKAAAAGATKAAAAGAGKAAGSTIAKGGIQKTITRAGIKAGGKTGGKIAQSIAKDPMGALDKAADLSYKAQMVGSMLPKPKPRTSGSGGGVSGGMSQTVSADADLFDIVKGQLLDEGLSEEEIRDIMLTLTPDEIMSEMAVNPRIAAMDAKNKADMIARAKAKEVPQNIRDASKRQMKAGTPREDPKNPYTTQDKKDIINYNKNK